MSARGHLIPTESPFFLPMQLQETGSPPLEAGSGHCEPVDNILGDPRDLRGSSLAVWVAFLANVDRGSWLLSWTLWESFSSVHGA